MLRQVAEGVLGHESEVVQSNAVVVQGRVGVLLIDPGVQDHEMACLANDLSDLGQPVVAGFSTHPDWDHGSVGGAGQVRARIDLDRAYMHALRNGGVLDDPRFGPSAKPGWEWVSDVHNWHAQRLARRGERDGTPG